MVFQNWNDYNIGLLNIAITILSIFKNFVINTNFIDLATLYEGAFAFAHGFSVTFRRHLRHFGVEVLAL